MKKNRKQDKVGGIHRLRRRADAGNPRCPPAAKGGDEGGSKARKNRGAAAYPNCRQRDERADRTAHGTARLCYESANKVINDALYYGLPILAEKVCGDAVTQEERAALKAPRKSGSKEEEFYALAVRLLRESVLNATINKSILSSLYNLMNDMLDPKSETTKQFESGLMSDTPAYLERYEAEGIKKLRR